MVLKLYGPILATNTQRVLAVAKILNVPLELVEVDLLKRANRLPDYLKIQPFGQVPSLDDDGFILFESRAIARYLSTVHAGGKLIPKGIKENALFEQAVSIEQSNFDPFAEVISHERFYKRRIFGTTTDETNASQQQVKLEAKLDAYEVILSKYQYLGGDELTLADLFHLPYGATVASPVSPGEPFVNFEDSKRPNVARWWKEISSIPEWKEIQAEFEDKITAIKSA